MKYYNKWKIKVNAAKTELIIFSKRNKLKKSERGKDLNIKINNELVEPKTEVKYLGMTLDKKLTYVSHIKKACTKAYQIKNLLNPLICRNSKLSTKNKLILYKSLIKPILLYAAPVWSGTYKTAINRIRVVQNKTLRLISQADYYISNENIQKQLNISDITEDIYKQTQKFYNYSIRKHNIFNNVGLWNSDNAPFKIRYRLPHSLLL